MPKHTYCIHNRIARMCKECDGEGLCIHKKSKPSCRVCRDNGIPDCGTAYCVHDRAKARCRECKIAGVPNCGTIYCQHDKVRTICVECKGSQICEHKKRKQQCRLCSGSAFCEHGKRKSCCHECSPKSFCKHGKHKHNCIECGTVRKCVHGNDKYKCNECGTSYKYKCLHGKWKNSCKECCESSICEHGIFRRVCKICKGAGICDHGKAKQNCKTCGGSALCKSPWCETYKSNKSYKGYCFHCFVHLFPDEPVTRNYKTKEKEVVSYITNRFSEVDWTHDKVVTDGCSNRRPDLLCDLGSHVIIVEVDENQHSTYESICENKRLVILSQDLGHRPMVMVRFNPDGYENENGEKIPSPWRKSKTGNLQIANKHEDQWKSRLVTLGDTVQDWMEQYSEKMIHCIELYYNGTSSS